VVGLTILAVVAVYIGIVWALVRFALKNNWARAAVVVAALGIPFWDLPIGYYEFQRLCSAEGGLRILKPVAPQERVFFDSMPSQSAEDLLAKGFKVVEIARADGKGIARHEFLGGIVTKNVAEPESAVRVTIRRNQLLSWNILRDDRIAQFRVNGELLARHSTFTWHGGWLKALASPTGFALHCFVSRDDQIVEWLANGS
jgi:hypothetical protein